MIHHVCLIIIYLGWVGAFYLDCMGEAEGWKGDEEAAILRLQIQELDSKEQIPFAPRYFFTSNNLRGESEGRLEAILSSHSLVKG